MAYKLKKTLVNILGDFVGEVQRCLGCEEVLRGSIDRSGSLNELKVTFQLIDFVVLNAIVWGKEDRFYIKTCSKDFYGRESVFCEILYNFVVELNSLDSLSEPVDTIEYWVSDEFDSDELIEKNTSGGLDIKVFNLKVED